MAAGKGIDKGPYGSAWDLCYTYIKRGSEKVTKK